MKEDVGTGKVCYSVKRASVELEQERKCWSR